MQQEKIWNYFQNNTAIADKAFDAGTRYKFLADKTNADLEVLNIGVGRGGLESILLSKNVKVYSLDPNEKSIQFLRDNLNLGDRAKVGFSQLMPFNDESFDVVIMSEVLEHLATDILLETLSECQRVLRKGGKFIGTVPADENLIKSLVVCPCCDNKFHRWGHVQSFTQENLYNLLSEKFNRITIDRKYFGNWKSLNWKGKISSILKQIFLKIGQKGDNENYFFSGIK